MNKPIKKEKEPDLNEWEAKAEEYLNGWKRAQADYQNLQREWQNKQGSFISNAREGLLQDLLPVFDNLKQALLHTPDQIKGTNWLTGLEHIETQWLKLLEQWSIEPIDTSGEFNPNIHEAVGADENTDENMIAKEVQGGYKCGEKVLVPARVIVGSKKIITISN
jgi:molecular chaperone GrpE